MPEFSSFLKHWFKPLFALSILASGMVACSLTPGINVGIDSINNSQPVAPGNYVLNPVAEGVDQTDLHFLEYSEYINDALAAAGLSPAGTDQAADIIIDVNYGITRHDRTISKPAFYSSAFYSFPHRRRCRHSTARGCRSFSRSRFRGSFGFGGFGFHDPYQVSVLTGYRVFVSLEARDANASDDTPALWATRARTLTRTPDLRATMPLLLAAARDYIGTDTGHEVNVNLPANDPALAPGHAAGS